MDVSQTIISQLCVLHERIFGANEESYDDDDDVLSSLDEQSRRLSQTLLKHVQKRASVDVKMDVDARLATIAAIVVESKKLRASPVEVQKQKNVFNSFLY